MNGNRSDWTVEKNGREMRRGGSYGELGIDDSLLENSSGKFSETGSSLKERILTKRASPFQASVGRELSEEI